jgi:hypothetical protein
MLTKAFLTAAAERMVKAFVSSLLATLGAGVVDVLSVPWGAAFAVAAGAAAVSFLTSVASAPTASSGPALFGPETVAPSE